VQLSLNKVRGAAGSFLLHAINLTAAPRRPVTALVPVHGLDAEIRIPGATGLKSFAVLRSEGCAVQVTDRVDAVAGCLVVTVQWAELREYVAIQLDVQ
jgi:hypothetical protein